MRCRNCGIGSDSKHSRRPTKQDSPETVVEDAHGYGAIYSCTKQDVVVCRNCDQLVKNKNEHLYDTGRCDIAGCDVFKYCCSPPDACPNCHHRGIHKTDKRVISGCTYIGYDCD